MMSNIYRVTQILYPSSTWIVEYLAGSKEEFDFSNLPPEILAFCNSAPYVQRLGDCKRIYHSRKSIIL